MELFTQTQIMFYSIAVDAAMVYPATDTLTIGINYNPTALDPAQATGGNE
jgi:hypothetical protein